MMLKRSLCLTTLLLVAQAQSAEIEVSLTNVTYGLHFTPVLVAAHTANSRLFQSGSAATPALQKMAEGGNMVKEGDVLLLLENQNLQLNFLQSETEASRLVNDLQNTRQRLKVDKFTLQKNLSDLDLRI